MAEAIEIKEITRLQFFARMRKQGFVKSRVQMARNGVTYSRGCIGEPGWVTVTIPKGHEETFHILGKVPYSGIYIRENNKTAWGIHVPAQYPMLSLCLGLCAGEYEDSNQ